MLTIQQIQEQAYATACEKGWHARPLREVRYVTRRGDLDADVFIDHDRVLAKHALMHTELAEACDCIEADDLPMYIEDGKPEGFAVEMVDLIVRICDTTAALGLTLDVDFSRVAGMRPAIEIQQSDENYTAALLWIGRVRCMIDQATEAARVDAWEDYARHLSNVVLYTASIVIGLECDLETALTTKLAYNKTRPHRHGGKQA